MARPSREERLRKIHQEALQEFNDIQEALRDERLQCLQDRRFYSLAGAQWEGPLREMYDNRPRFEVNKIHLSVIRIINEYRNNRIAVDYVAKDGSADNTLADTCDKLYRADCQDSGAEEAFDNAFEEAVGGGYGAFRLKTTYINEEDDEDERQRIAIEPIFDADSSVFFDLGAKRQDKADAKRCFVVTAVPRKTYIAEYDDDPATWPKEIHQYEFDWATPDVVFVAEYYRIEDRSETIRIFETVVGEEERYTDADFEADPELEQRLAAIGTVEVRQKRVRRRVCRAYIMSGSRVLEDLGVIPGRMIPVVPVYGKRWYIDNVERCMGHVRLAKDAQRLKNMQLSKLGEISAYSSIEKPIFTPEQVSGHQVMWAEDNLRNYPYLLINPITDTNGQTNITGPVAFTKSAAIPPALAGLMQVTETDMQEILGSSQQADKMVANISGKAVEMIQARIDGQAFIYMSNMAKAVRRCGEIWLSMARDVYVEPGRKMKGIGAQGEIESIEIAKPMIVDGKLTLQNDLSEAEFDVAVDVGPTSISRKAATVRALTGMMAITQDPETQQVLQAMAMLNMEGEGVTEVRDYFRKKLVRMGVVKPTDEEREQLVAELQGQSPDPNSIFLAAAAEEAQAKAARARADTIKVLADADLSQAKTVETLSKVDQSVLEQTMAMQAAPQQGVFIPEQL